MAEGILRIAPNPQELSDVYNREDWQLITLEQRVTKADNPDEALSIYKDGKTYQQELEAALDYPRPILAPELHDSKTIRLINILRSSLSLIDSAQ